MRKSEIACNKLSLTSEENRQYEGLRAEIFRKLVKIDELEHGFSFVLNQEADLLHQLADWIPLEHKCCPFLQFNLSLYEEEQIRLSLTGPDEIKGFLVNELNLT